MTSSAPSTTLIRDLYARMLLTRIVDDYAWRLYEQGYIDFVASSRGHEATQVGSAICIEVGKDFTLPYYRDLGVVLTIGMTPYEVFRTYLQTHRKKTPTGDNKGHAAEKQQPMHWGYHKHNTVTGPAPVATQLLHAAGIAFASKLRKVPVVTVAYCGDGATTEQDFHEGIRFAALHQLPVIFVCEQDCSQSSIAHPDTPSCTQGLALPAGLTHQRIDGTDIVAVYTAMRTAMQQAREGHGPLLLEMYVTRSTPTLHMHRPTEDINVSTQAATEPHDPLVHCQHYLQEHGAWDEEWAAQLSIRISTEVERALHDALRDTSR
jgi:2-oxoisovalerate dehydrogenase E1 component alpha subunit